MAESEGLSGWSIALSGDLVVTRLLGECGDVLLALILRSHNGDGTVFGVEANDDGVKLRLRTGDDQRCACVLPLTDNVACDQERGQSRSVHRRWSACVGRPETGRDSDANMPSPGRNLTVGVHGIQHEAKGSKHHHVVGEASDRVEC